MTVIARNGLYFSGKIKDLLKELRSLSKEYNTLQDIVNKNLQ
ncbi:hypothetical protein [Sporomusa sp.]|jgi:hypothetical protein|nr:hypothetical protein [Sporomusa sp.]MDF2570772.1 hypothetical protein [Sporomusa sp.]MDF2875060.1 hypothetical protein [Sporomusa sp.]HWR06309.1 hypothetical protein [Sporomusa sp.]